MDFIGGNMYDEDYVEQDYGESYNEMFYEIEERIEEHLIEDRILMNRIREMDRDYN